MLRLVLVLTAIIVALLGLGSSACRSAGRPALSSNSSLAVNTTPASTIETVDAELTERLKTLCTSAQGDIGVAVIYVETSRTALIDGTKELPLYSVFKLPLAVTVLKDVEEKQFVLDTKVHVTPDEVAPGAQ